MATVRTDDRRPGVRFLYLDRPPANAIDDVLLGDLCAALDDARADDAVRAVVVTGTGRFFSAGLDLASAVGDRQASDRVFRSSAFRDGMLALFTFPRPTIAAISGHTIAGGLIIALACDFRIAVEGDYRLGVNEVAIGASYPKVAFEIGRLRLSDAQAREALLGAQLYPVHDALRLGFVDDVVPAARFHEHVLSLAERLGAYPRDAYAHTKAAFIREAVERVNSETQEEARETAGVWRSPESLAALQRQFRSLKKHD